MSDQNTAKTGCAGAGCATLVALFALPICLYFLCFNTAMDVARKCSFERIAQLQYATRDGQVASGCQALLNKAEAMGVNTSMKLSKAIARKKCVSEVKYTQKDYLVPEVKQIVVSMRVKGAAHGDAVMDVALVFLVEPRSLSGFKTSRLLGLAGITVSDGGRSENLEMETSMPGSEIVTSPGPGFAFLAVLFMDGDKELTKFADEFIADANTPPPPSGPAGQNNQRGGRR